jgi:hypothetical protein
MMKKVYTSISAIIALLAAVVTKVTLDSPEWALVALSACLLALIATTRIIREERVQNMASNIPKTDIKFDGSWYHVSFWDKTAARRTVVGRFKSLGTAVLEYGRAKHQQNHR